MKNKNLGKEATDIITGFKGVATGHAEYLTGCDQYCVQPILKKDGNLEDARWFDDGRLLFGKVKIQPEEVQGKENGCDYIAPIK